jgi:hypothetical protein
MSLFRTFAFLTASTLCTPALGQGMTEAVIIISPAALTCKAAKFEKEPIRVELEWDRVDDELYVDAPTDLEDGCAWEAEDLAEERFFQVIDSKDESQLLQQNKPTADGHKRRPIRRMLMRVGKDHATAIVVRRSIGNDAGAGITIASSGTVGSQSVVFDSVPPTLANTQGTRTFTLDGKGNDVNIADFTVSLNEKGEYKVVLPFDFYNGADTGTSVGVVYVEAGAKEDTFRQGRSHDVILCADDGAFQVDNNSNVALTKVRLQIRASGPVTYRESDFDF